MAQQTAKADIHFLLYGHRGWIGNHIVKHIENIQKKADSGYNIKISLGKVRVSNHIEVDEEIKAISPTHIISTIGRTHGTLEDGTRIENIDYLESMDKVYDNVHDNLYAPMALALLATKYKIHLTYLGTGCIFHYNTKDEGNCNYDLEQKFTEQDKPNFFGSQYSLIKVECS